MLIKIWLISSSNPSSHNVLRVYLLNLFLDNEHGKEIPAARNKILK